MCADAAYTRTACIYPFNIYICICIDIDIYNGSSGSPRPAPLRLRLAACDRVGAACAAAPREGLDVPPGFAAGAGKGALEHTHGVDGVVVGRGQLVVAGEFVAGGDRRWGRRGAGGPERSRQG